MFDNYAFYRNITRHVTIRANNVSTTNTTVVPRVEKICYTFRLRKLEDLDDVQLYNYMYMLKFFWGTRGTMVPYKSFFSLGA